MRSAVTMSQSPLSPSTTPLNATRSRPRRLAPDPLGRGQYENGTKHPLIVCCDGKYNAQRRGASHPLCASLQGLLGLCRLRPVCYAYPLVKVALSRDIDRRTVYRISNRYPLSNLGTAYSGTPPVIGTCFGCRVSAAGYLPQRAENNQLRGISGLVSRLYLGFYIPFRKEFGSSKFEPYSSR